MTSYAQLRRAAERAADRPFFLASALLAVARAERLDDAALASRLGCDPAALPSLLLCRKPAGEGAVFRSDVEAIADRFGIGAARLAQLIRAGDALHALGRSPSGAPGQLLAAARDRELPSANDHHQPDGLPLSRPSGDHPADPTGHPLSLGREMKSATWGSGEAEGPRARWTPIVASRSEAGGEGIPAGGEGHSGDDEPPDPADSREPPP